MYKRQITDREELGPIDLLLPVRGTRTDGKNNEFRYVFAPEMPYWLSRSWSSLLDANATTVSLPTLTAAVISQQDDSVFSELMIESHCEHWLNCFMDLLQRPGIPFEQIGENAATKAESEVTTATVVLAERDARSTIFDRLRIAETTTFDIDLSLIHI